MKASLSIPLTLLVVTFIGGAFRAAGDDTPPVQTFVQVTFDRLIPTAAPTVQPDFNRLRQPRFDRLIPSSSPAPSPASPTLRPTVSFGFVPWSFPIEQMNFNRLNQITFSPKTPTLPGR